VEKKS
jgi:dynein heavy chain, axonemal